MFRVKIFKLNSKRKLQNIDGRSYTKEERSRIYKWLDEIRAVAMVFKPEPGITYYEISHT